MWCHVLVELNRWLEDSTKNLIVRMVARKRYFGAGSGYFYLQIKIEIAQIESFHFFFTTKSYNQLIQCATPIQRT